MGQGLARGAKKGPAVRVPVSSPTPVNPRSVRPAPVLAPIIAPEELNDEREEFATSVARLLRNKTTYEPEDMFDEDGKRKSLDQLLQMAKYAPIWSMLSPSERSAVNYTAGVLENDMCYIIKIPNEVTS